MKITFISLFFLCFSSLLMAQEGKSRDLFVGTFTSEGAEGIYLCSFNTQTGELTEKRVFKGIDNPNFLCLSGDGKLLFTVSRPPEAVDPGGGSVSSYRIRENGDLEFITKQASHGDDPCYVDVSEDGRWVAVANYGGGSVAFYPVAGDGSLMPATTVFLHKGSGTDKKRQTKAYAHSVCFSGDGSLAYAADLGCDKLFLYAHDRSTGHWIPAGQPYASLPPGSGPRHFVFSGDEKFCYVVNELSSTVTVFENVKGQFSEIQNISTLPEGFSGVSYCADIHISPDGKQVYASNRGDNSIVVFQRTASGMLETLRHISTEGNWPRNFSLDPDGRFLLVANQRSHNITIFRLIEGIPVFTGKELKVTAPVCLEFR